MRARFGWIALLLVLVSVGALPTASAQTTADTEVTVLRAARMLDPESGEVIRNDLAP